MIISIFVSFNIATRRASRESRYKAMTIKKSENESLFRLYEAHKMLVGGKTTIQKILESYLEGAKYADKEHFDEFYENYCNDKSLDSSEQESLESFILFNKKLLSRMYGEFNVEVLSDSFFEALSETNLETALNGRNLFDILGETNGILLFPDGGFMLYAIMDDGASFHYHEPGNQPFLEYSYLFGKFDTGLLSDKEDDTFLSALYTTLNVLLLKKVGQTFMLRPTMAITCSQNVFLEDVMIMN